MLKMLKNKVLGSTVALCALLIVTTLLLLVSSSFAYFKAIIDTQGVNSMMIELIFDRLDDEGFAAYKAKYNTAENPFEPTPEATWGTKENPYVISQKYHVQNLSVLQNAGFFEKRLDANGDPIQAHFLVCNPDGSVVAINCGGMKIAPIGTHELPFTGVVLGAPKEGTSSYTNAAGQSYGTSLSAIANLTVETTLGEPDIGFFGRLGYFGEKTTGEDDFGNETVTVNGYAADVEDLLLADVTIRSRYSLLDNIANWWAGLTGHLNNSADRAESHHVGIVAGHAEFATVKNVSVYYSENVVTFDLVGNDSGSNTNYYSTTGLIGLLDCVNPVVGTDGVLDGSDAVSDDVLVGDGTSGGGGDESGTMTGYFLAKNLFDRHEEYLTAQSITTKDKYSVTEMKDVNGDDLFETSTMRERESMWEGWKYYNYYYFQDTVFTFAMTMKVPSNQNGNVTGDPVNGSEDYVHKLWIMEDENRPTLSATDSFDKFQYSYDPDAPVQVSYYLESVDESGNVFTPTAGDYYVLAYHDQGVNLTDASDDKIYLLNLNDKNGENGYAYLVNSDEIYTDPDTDIPEIRYIDNATYGDIASIKLIGTNPVIYNFAISYASNAEPIKHPTRDEKFGVKTIDNKFNALYTTIQSGNQTGGTNYTLLGKSNAFLFGWTMQPKDGSPNKYAFVGEASIGQQLGGYANHGWQMLAFDNGSFYFDYELGKNANNRAEGRTPDENNYFTLFKVNANVVDSNNVITSPGEGNEELSPKNIFPTYKDDGSGELDTLYDFDPSKYVLQYTGTSTEGEYSNIKNYKLLPIRSLKLNDGTGNLLEELNHVTSLYKTHEDNYTLSIGNLLGGGNLGNWIDNLTGTNSGGIINTTIGVRDVENTENEQNLYSIPTGMIAFEINEASVEKPSYINIIVAVIPNTENAERAGEIALWAREKEGWQGSFNVDQESVGSFSLPISTAANSISDKKNIVKITERVIEEDDNGKSVYSVVKNGDVNETSYMYLGGEIILVYHTFEVTSQGVYMLGSKAGPISVAYFSVTGAAGKGNDGMSGSPLGNVDFVYDFGGNIITTDKHYVGEAPLINLEEYENYYPSYLFVGMLPEKDQGTGNVIKIQNEVIKIRRYIAGNTDTTGTKRHLQMLDEILTKIRPASPVMEDYQDDID